MISNYLYLQSCLYEIFVKTGDVKDAGTNSSVTLTLFNRILESFTTHNLTEWGILPADHIYFQRGNLDVFLYRHDCLSSPICGIVLQSDGSGDNPDWYVEYANVTTLTPSVDYYANFNISQWLALDKDPYNLSALREHCDTGKNRPMLANGWLSFLKTVAQF